MTPPLHLRTLGLLSVICALAFPLTAQAQGPALRVRLYWATPGTEMELTSGTLRYCSTCPEEPITAPLKVKAAGERLQITARTAAGEVPRRATNQLRVTGDIQAAVVRHGPIRLNHPLDIRAQKGRLLLTITIPLEDYVLAALAGEVGGEEQAEALKAAAVAARTYAVAFRGRHQSEGFDFCDTTHCQDIRLVTTAPHLREAALSTAGEMLWFRGEPAETYYHRHCGGTTEAADVAWPGKKRPYLPQQTDTFCTARSKAEWHSEIRKTELQDALMESGLGKPPTLESVRIVSRTPSGRVARIRIEGSTNLEFTGDRFRLLVGRALGWERVRSDLYDVRDSGDRFVFDGRGAGHGVGLCQVGAVRVAEIGKSYQEILSFYYPRTVLGLNAQGLAWQTLTSETIELQCTRPQDDGGVIVVAERMLREAETRAGWRLATRAKLRVYPSVAVFRNATAQPGWIAAYTRGGTIRLQPVSTLRAAGTLEKTLRHEMLHLLIERRAATQGRGMPLWFREGLALVLEDDSGATTMPIPFPDSAALDRALAAPRSREEMEQAYRAARARVQDLIRKHGRDVVLGWLERGMPPNS